MAWFQPTNGWTLPGPEREHVPVLHSHLRMSGDNTTAADFKCEKGLKPCENESCHLEDHFWKGRIASIPVPWNKIKVCVLQPLQRIHSGSRRLVQGNIQARATQRPPIQRVQYANQEFIWQIDQVDFCCKVGFHLSRGSLHATHQQCVFLFRQRKAWFPKDPCEKKHLCARVKIVYLAQHAKKKKKNGCKQFGCKEVFFAYRLQLALKCEAWWFDKNECGFVVVSKDKRIIGHRETEPCGQYSYSWSEEVVTMPVRTVKDQSCWLR